MIREDNNLGKKIRTIRKGNGLTLKRMASACGLSSSFLSQVETGAVNPSLATVKAIADALNISLGQLFTEKPSGEGASACLTKPENRRTFTVDEGIKFQLLTRGIDVPFEFLLNRFPPGSTFGEGFHTHEGTESALLLEGELKVETDGEVHHLKPGDTLTMKSSIPHRVSNSGEKDALAVWVDSIPWIFSTK
jgi:transcriptional regulator with XRE-family HTH domain